MRLLLALAALIASAQVEAQPRAASVLIFTAMEIGIAVLLAPAIFAGRLASPMLQMRLEMIMHLGSFLVGGLLVGLVTARSNAQGKDSWGNHANIGRDIGRSESTSKRTRLPSFWTSP